MKNILIKSVGSLILLFAVVLQHSCIKDVLETTYTYYEPVVQPKAQVLLNIKSNAAQPLKHTGKLVKYGNYIFVNELNEGVHIIDNTNPASPLNKGFISIPGNIDIALKNNMLYADIYTDMVAVDISNADNVVLKKVINKVFPERQYDYGIYNDSLNYITGWVKHTTKSKTEFDHLKNLPTTGGWLFMSASSSGTGITGVSGSMARLTIVNNYLYTVGRTNLSAFNISVLDNPVLEHVNGIGWNIETIYPFKDNLFIGGQTGMFIYSITNPSTPTLLGSFSHACFNDPVIADGDYAYVTLRARTETSPCWGVPSVQSNELDIIGINDLRNPVLLKVYNMTAPQGLSKDGHLLFICDSGGGLKIYNATNPLALQLVKQFNDIKPFDVIAQAGLAIVVADGGVYQYDYTNPANIIRISKIAINK